MTKSSLPQGWSLVKFGDLAESITERVDDPKAAGVEIYVGLEHLDSDTTKISRFGTPDDVEASKLRFYPGDVIYARRRAYQRKLGVAEVEGICSAHALVLRARPDVCVPEFLPYFLQSDQFHERALSISVGSLSPTINWKTLVAQQFVLPPVAVQRSIAKAMSTLECTRDLYFEIETATLRTAIVLAAGPSNLILKERVDSLCENVRSSSLGRELDSAQHVVGLEHMTSGEVFQKQFGDNTSVSGVVTKFARGDVLYGKLRPNLRKVSIATFDGYCTTEILALRPRKICSSEVLHAILSSKFVLNEVLKFSKGTKMPRVNPGDLMSIEVPRLNDEQLRSASVQLRALNSMEEKRVASYQRSSELIRAARESLLNGQSGK